MWGSKYCPRQHHEGRKSVPVVLRRRSFGPARNDSNNAYRSTYGVWNDSYGIRCGLWDDVLYQYSRNCQHESKRRRNVNVPISKVTTTPSPHVRYEALALPKTTGCGPNCKKSRCAATDPPYYYAKPSCATNKRRAKKRRAGTSESSPSVKIYTYSTIAHVQDKVLELGRCDMTMGLKNIKKVEEPEVIEELPTCERKCGECSEARSRESTEEEVELERGGTQESGLKSLARTRTVGSNTEEVSQAAAEIPVRVLQDVSNNTVLDWSEKIAPPVVRRLKIPTPIPRVAFLRPPKPRPTDILECEGDQLSTPRLPTPRTTRPIWSSSPASLTSRRVPPSRIPPQTQKLMPGKLAPRLFTPPTTILLSRTGNLSFRSLIPPETEKAQNKPEPAHLQQGSPPLQPFTPTPQESSKLSSKQCSKQCSKQSSKQSSEQSSKESSKQYSEQSSIEPSKQSSEQSSKETSKQYFEQSSKEPSKQSSEQSSKETSKQYFEKSSKESSKPSSEQSSKESSKQYSEQSSKESSKQSSKSDSLVTSVSDFEDSSRSTGSSKIPGGLAPVLCLCSLCGKCESINESSQGNGATIYRNNPLYSPGRALATTMVQHNSNTGPSRWRFLYTFVEVMFLVVLAGALTVAMIPYVETVFRAYVADYCAKGRGNGGPQVTADGMQSGVVKWVNCMIDDSRSTLTPVR